MSQEHTLNLLKTYEDQDKTSTMVWETCFLAKELIRWNNETQKGKTEDLDFSRLRFKTNDPAPPFNIYTGADAEANKDIGKLQ